MINVFVMIGNSDNKLSQEDWSKFIKTMRITFGGFAVVTVWGEFHCLPDIQYQNVCWHIGVLSEYPMQSIKNSITIVAKDFNQDSIAWLECKDTEFLGR